MIKAGSIVVATVLALGSIPAHAQERRPLLLPPEVAAQRTRQLSPGSGIFPGYTHPQQAGPYMTGTVVLQGGVPVGVVDTQGRARPVGAYDDGRGGPPVAVTKE